MITRIYAHGMHLDWIGLGGGGGVGVGAAGEGGKCPTSFLFGGGVIPLGAKCPLMLFFMIGQMFRRAVVRTPCELFFSAKIERD